MAQHCRPLIRGKELGHAHVLITIFAEPLYLRYRRYYCGTRVYKYGIAYSVR